MCGLHRGRAVARFTLAEPCSQCHVLKAMTYADSAVSRHVGDVLSSRRMHLKDSSL
jgi:hypothetical protein